MKHMKTLRGISIAALALGSTVFFGSCAESPKGPSAVASASPTAAASSTSVLPALPTAAERARLSHLAAGIALDPVMRHRALSSTYALAEPKSRMKGRRDGLPAWVSTPAQSVSDLVATAPKDARGAFSVSLGNSQALETSLTLVGAKASPGILESTYVRYPGAWEDTDILAAANRSYWEQILVLNSPRAPHTFTYKVATAANLHFEHRANGSLELQDANGTLRMVMEAPYAVDASGEKRPAALLAVDDTIELELNTEGLTYPIALDPGMVAFAWSEFFDRPPARSGSGSTQTFPSMVYDAARGTNLFFGGGRDTWIWDGQTWAQRLTNVAPPVFNKPGLGYDAFRRRVVLVGGAADTWEWDGATWRSLPKTRPRSITGQLAYSEADKKLLATNGKQLWSFDGTTWDSYGTADASTPEHGNLVSCRNRLFALSVSQGPGLLEWDAGAGGQWRTRMPSGALNPGELICLPGGTEVRLGILVRPGEFPSVPSKPGSAIQLIKENGATFTSDAPILTNNRFDAWAPNARHEHSILYGAIGSPSYGGLHDGIYKVGAPLQGRNFDTYLYTRAVTGSSLGNQAQRDAAWLDLDSGTLYTSFLSGGIWAFPPNGGSGRAGGLNGAPVTMGHAAVYLPGPKKFIGFGGLTIVSQFPTDFRASDRVYIATATSDSLSFEECTTTSAKQPSGRAFAQLVHDANNNKLLLFGGKRTVGTGGTDLTTDTSTWELTLVDAGSNRYECAWTEYATPLPFDPRTAAVAYDAGRKEILVVAQPWSTPPPSTFPTPARKTLTYFWTGSAWSELSAITNTPPRAAAGMNYDARLQRMMLYGGSEFGQAPEAGRPSDGSFLWQLVGNAWESIALAESPTSATYTGGGFDPKRMQHTAQFDLEVWHLRTAGTSCTSNADCPNAFCTDGVCCDTSVCGTCETCAGATPGICTAVRTEFDPQTCEGSKKCNAAGVCSSNDGEPCSSATACASGFCVDGVCCNSACNGTCEACSIAQKANGRAAGVCGTARSTATRVCQLCAEDCGPFKCINRAAVGEEPNYGCARPCKDITECSGNNECVAGACIAPPPLPEASGCDSRGTRNARENGTTAMVAIALALSLQRRRRPPPS
jgi:hypothetical protein